MSQRGVLTVDLECRVCRGLGRISEHVPGRVVYVLCACVRPAPVYSEADGGTSIGPPAGPAQKTQW